MKKSAPGKRPSRDDHPLEPDVRAGGSSFTALGAGGGLMKIGNNQALEIQPKTVPLLTQYSGLFRLTGA